MIKKAVINNYRLFKNLIFIPEEGVNILVGDNQSGKSTLLEALTLALCSRINGKWAAEEINPYWFNREAVDDFFSALNSGGFSLEILPTILIEVYFDPSNDDLANLKGVWNSETTDAPGIKLHIKPDTSLLEEIKAYFETADVLPEIIPTEFYEVEWSTFKGVTINRQPRELSFSKIDSSTPRNTSGIDYFMRVLLRDYVNPEESRSIAVDLRKSRQDISSSTLKGVEDRMKEEGVGFDLGLQMDQSANARWETTVIPSVEGAPFSMAGQGAQVCAKVELSLHKAAEKHIILIEEPENHLSHTALTKLLATISEKTGGQQIFITTHSTFVLNRLGLDKLHLLNRGSIVPFKEKLTSDTVSFFQKLSGYDTLRFILAEKVVVVEGPSDEMVFNWGYKKEYSVEPRDNGIDVVSFGISGKRVLELAAAMDRSVAVLRDNDGKEPDHWKGAANEYLEEGKREMFIGKLELGSTLEPQMINTNAESEEILRSSIGAEEEGSLEDYMRNNKTEWALQFVTSDETGALQVPEYFSEAIRFTHDLQ